jgi:hypothetical protein
MLDPEKDRRSLIRNKLHKNYWDYLNNMLDPEKDRRSLIRNKLHKNYWDYLNNMSNMLFR